MTSKSAPGSPIDLCGTRRAFALDSRTVWVEQQIVMNGIVSKDNLFVSPLDYDPKTVERHIPTTTIARPRTVDAFHPYRGNTGGTNNLNSKRGSGKLKLTNTADTPKKKTSYKESLGDIRGTLGANSRTEYVSVFSDHDKRMPLDPSRRFYITDTPALPVDPFLAKHMHADGPRGPDQLGSFMCKDQSARTKIVLANPQSDSVYDTDRDMFKKRTQGGKFSSQGRRDEKKTLRAKQVKKKGEGKGPEQGQKPPPSPCPELPLRNGAAKVSSGPPLRTRKQPVVKYDASCYKLNKKEGAINMTPKESRSRAKVNVFQGMITTRLGYKSKNVESPVSERIRRNYM